MAHFLTLQSVDAVLGHIRQCSPGSEERVSLAEAFGRTLAHDFSAPEDLPGFARSCMDGFAVRAQNVFGASESSPALLEYIGECPMGAPTMSSLAYGECMRIWTGGMLPEGADAVVMLEYARQAGTAGIELTKPVAPGDNIVARDEDARQGQVLLAAGSILRPQEIGLLAAFGQEAVTVRAQPCVAVISTGDEVLPINARPNPGQVRDVNSHTLVALARAAGAQARSLGIVKDEAAKLKEKLLEAIAWADVVLLSGGSSAGQRDFTAQVFESLPGCSLLAHGVAISPGKPLILARLGQKTLWGLPGHVTSALVCAEVFIRPLIRRLLGQKEQAPAWQRSLRARLTRSVASAQGRREYIRVALEFSPEEGAPLLARPLLGKSGLISTLVQADALIICPEEQEGIKAGALVDLYPLL